MPKPIALANGEGAPSASQFEFNKSAIMHRAWQLYRESRSACSVFSRRVFAWALRSAWAEARIFRQSAEQEAARSAMSDPERMVADLKDRIAAVDYLPLGMSAGRRRAELRGELAALAA